MAQQLLQSRTTAQGSTWRQISDLAYDFFRHAPTGGGDGELLATLDGPAWTRTAISYGATALAILLLMLALRHSGERVGRLTEQLETMEKTHAGQRRMLEAAARRPPSCDDLSKQLRNGRFCCCERRGLSARRRVQQGAPSAGGRRNGSAVGDVGDSGDVGQICCPAEPCSCRRGRPQVNIDLVSARENLEKPSSGPLVKRYAKRIP